MLKAYKHETYFRILLNVIEHNDITLKKKKYKFLFLDIGFNCINFNIFRYKVLIINILNILHILTCYITRI